jgi:hypothetical protein
VTGEACLWTITGHRLLLQADGTYRFGSGTFGVARNGHTVRSTVIDDATFWAFISAVATFCGLSPPTSFTSKIVEGSTNVWID